MSSLYLWILGAVIFFIFCCWSYSHFRHWHVGYGMVLAWKEEDGTVWVTSRLVNSPAGHSDVQSRTQVGAINGKKMIFQNGEEFLKWFQKNKPRTDTEDLWKFTNGLTVKMTPIWIWQKIPVYWSPNEKHHPVHGWSESNLSSRREVGWCERTNQQYIKKRNTPKKVQEAFFAR